MRFHILGVPHTRTHPAWSGCAFTQKVLKFLKMMSGRGHQLIHYGHEHSQIHAAPDIEHVTVITSADHRIAYGDDYVDRETWRERGFAAYYKTDDHAHRVYHANAIKEIARRKQPHDFVLHFWGWGTKPVGDAHADLINCEPGIGNGSGWTRWRIYESHAVRNAMGGATGINMCQQDWYHRVIPNYFDVEDFDYKIHKSDYCLYLGRVGWMKGVDIAIEATREAGQQLIVAGQGTLREMGYGTVPDHVVEYGYADPAARRQLMADASSLFIASRYGEPFGGVQVEAWLSGTPVISPDWAAFAELNEHGVTGYRCWTFADFVDAVVDCQEGIIQAQDCRQHGMRFTFERVAPMYEKYFQDVLNVYTGSGWYQR